MGIAYKQYRERTPLGTLRDHSFIGYICSVLSPYVAVPCIRRGIRPNTITMMMIIAGIVGGIVLIIPNLWCKLISALLYILWFTFDCADGEVARYTQTFSKGGTLLDWCAHLITHSLFIVAMWLSIQQYYDINPFFLSAVSFLFIIAELLHRNEVSIEKLFYNSGDNVFSVKSLSLVRYIYFQIIYMPNLLFFFPLLLFVDIFFQVNIFVYIYICWIVFYGIIMLKFFFALIYKLYKS